jgi:hypothetical protein
METGATSVTKINGFTSEEHNTVDSLSRLAN